MFPVVRRCPLLAFRLTPTAVVAAEHFGWFTMFAGIAPPASGARTRAALGWHPAGPSLLADIHHPAYFTQPKP
jgi:hypothetical protein